MADEIWVKGEMAHRNASKFVNAGGVPGVSAGIVDQAAFNVRNRNNAREWLFNELERQRYREAYNITFDTDDGHEKERFTAARREYFDTYGEDFMGEDANMPWQDTYLVEAVDKPVEAVDKPVEAVEKKDEGKSAGEDAGELEQLKAENEALRSELDAMKSQIEALIARLTA